ncbi:hypothetical protein B0H10DRAFT_1940388 [Mycena sp. CBHHK59/15]|nr:hypothetical protein B0H10DRAFT_1940388 [Mycena sp. CBHHK59/15]
MEAARLTDGATKFCALIEDASFWNGLETVLGDLEPICLRTNINQKDSMCLDQVLLTIAGIFLHSADHPEPEVKKKMLLRLEKRWEDCNQPVFLLALILNPFERLSCFGPVANLNQFKCRNLLILLYHRMNSRPDNEDSVKQREVKEDAVSKAFMQYLAGMADFTDFDPEDWERVNIKAQILSEHQEQGLIKPRAGRRNHKSLKTLLSVPRYHQDDENPSERGCALVSSAESWRTVLAKWIGDARTVEHEEVAERAELEAAEELEELENHTPQLLKRLPIWKPMTLQALFGGAEKPRTRKLSACMMEEEEILMEALADEIEEAFPDDGAIEVDSDEEYIG